MNDQSYEFVPVEKLTCVYDIHEIQDRPNKLFVFFLESDHEIFYVMSEGMLYGLVSIGDICRYYDCSWEREGVIPINQNFSYIEDAEDYEGAQAFFERVKSIHEIPVIKDKRLLGVVRCQITLSEKENRDKLISALIDSRRKLLNREKIKKFIDLAHVMTMIYEVPGSLNSLTCEQKRAINKGGELKSYICSKSFELMSEVERDNFLSRYTQDRYMERFICATLDGKELKLSVKNGIHKYEDCFNQTFHIVNGYRKTPNASTCAKRKIWMFGPCIVFGAFVKDSETIAYYLQQYLLDHGYDNYEVVNGGKMRPALYNNSSRQESLFTTQISSDDIVIILELEKYLASDSNDKVLGNSYKGSLQDIYEQNIGSLTEHVFGAFAHCDAFINKGIAERIFSDLLSDLTKDNSEISVRKALQNYYIPYDINLYYEDLFERYDLYKKSDKKTGAIVMNCNPFTYGHRHLIEYACDQVDILYIFVVEEDKSFFGFEDRLEMVKQGTEDIEKVQVLPSGRYIISQTTFGQYFTKDQVITEIDDVDYDVRIFGEVVADILGISCRFVGEEPFDKVTKNYNETMKRILPEYGVELIEIPRKEWKGNVISASAVRKYLKQGGMDKVCELVPESTMKICSKYL